MKFIFVDTYYLGFLSHFRSRHPHLASKNYAAQKKALLKSCFGTSDYYSRHLQELGHKAEDLIINDEILQRQWARENNQRVRGAGLWAKLQSTPLIHRLIGRPSWMQQIALAQIKKAQADIIYVQDLSALNPSTLKEVKRHCKLLVGQIACPLPAKENLKQFDLILTSFPHYVNRFRQMGIKSEYFKIAFEPRVWQMIEPQKRIYDVAFIGSYSYHHRSGTKLFEKVASRVSVNFWGLGGEGLPESSPIKKTFHGPAFGLEMYKILAQTKIVINRHISAAENNANNMRLFESTGMGAMLITDAKKNLAQLFKVDEEVVAYNNIDDLIKKIKYYLKDEKERRRIAAAGQKRTLTEHSYANRMKELVGILEKYLKED